MKDVNIPKEFTENEVQAILGNTCIVYVYRDHCPRCGPMKELLSILESKYQHLTFLSVIGNDPNLEFCKRLGVDETPSVVLFVGGSQPLVLKDPVRVAEEIKKVANAKDTEKNSAGEVS